MKRIIWFSRHQMTESQKKDLENVLNDDMLDIKHVSKTIKHVIELKKESEWCDIACMVLPIDMQEDMIKLLNGKPLLISRNHRIQNKDGRFEFVHAGWDRLVLVKIVKEELSKIEKPKTFKYNGD